MIDVSSDGAFSLYVLYTNSFPQSRILDDSRKNNVYEKMNRKKASRKEIEAVFFVFNSF